MMSTNRLFNNTILYFVGSFGTRVIQLLFIPIYTIFLSPDELGIFNVIFSVIIVIIPILFTSIWEGVLRFRIENNQSEERLISTVNIYILILSFIYSGIFLSFSVFFNVDYSIYILLMALSQMIVSYWQFCARALEKNRAFAVSSIISALVNVILSLILIVWLKMGLEGLFIANIGASIFLTIVIEKEIRIISKKYFSEFKLKLLKDLLKYSLPLSINAVSWWLINSSSNLIIAYQIDFAEAGVYSIASRFGAIMAIVTAVINMAWLEEAFKTHNTKGADEYFNNILNMLIKLVFSGLFLLIPTTYLIYKYFVFGDFKNGVSVTPLIYLSAAFATFSAHLGSRFLARKESGIIFKTTLIAGGISVLGGYSTAKYLGITGVAIFALIGTVAMFLVRVPLLKKRMNLHINYLQLIVFSFMALVIAFLANLYPDSVIYQISLLLVILVFNIIINSKELIFLISKIKDRFNLF